MKFQDDISNMKTHIHTDKPKPICPPLFQIWGHNKLISAPNHHQTIIVACFIASVTQIGKPFHPMVLYETNLICIFMNINENLKNEEKSLIKLVPKA